MRRKFLGSDPAGPRRRLLSSMPESRRRGQALLADRCAAVTVVLNRAPALVDPPHLQPPAGVEPCSGGGPWASARGGKVGPVPDIHDHRGGVAGMTPALNHGNRLEAGSPPWRREEPGIVRSRTHASATNRGEVASGDGHRHRPRRHTGRPLKIARILRRTPQSASQPAGQHCNAERWPPELRPFGSGRGYIAAALTW